MGGGVGRNDNVLGEASQFIEEILLKPASAGRATHK